MRTWETLTTFCIYLYTYYHLFYFLSSFGFVVLYEAVVGMAIVGCFSFYFFYASFSFYCCLTSNRLNASSTISSVSPFLRKNIFFSMTGIRSMFSPPRKCTAIPIFFSFSSSFFNYSSYFFFCLASELPINIDIVYNHDVINNNYQGK